MKGIKNENDWKYSLHGIRRNGKTPPQDVGLLYAVTESKLYATVNNSEDSGCITQRGSTNVVSSRTNGATCRAVLYRRRILVGNTNG